MYLATSSTASNLVKVANRELVVPLMALFIGSVYLLSGCLSKVVVNIVA